MLFREFLFDAEDRLLGDGGEAHVSSLTFRSGEAGPGSVFFCLPGAHADGHDYAVAAYAGGCRLFVAERALALPADATVLLTSTVAVTMAKAAAVFYGQPAKMLSIVGITGTKGKTTTALMTQSLLEGIGIPTAYIGTNGVRYGEIAFATENTTPDSVTLHRLFRKILDAGIRVVVMEVSSQALSTHRVHGIPFSCCVFTNLSRDHIGAGEHADEAAYRRAKESLFLSYGSAVSVCNCADAVGRAILGETASPRRISYAVGMRADYTAFSCRPMRGEHGLSTSFSLGFEGETASLSIPLAGRHYVEDFLAALACASEVSGRSPSLFLPLAAALTVPGRCESRETPRGALFVIDYAHNGASLAAALRGLRPYAERRLYCLFGAVGGHSRCRRADMAEAACRHADFSVITEDNSDFEPTEAILHEIHEAFPDPARAVCIPDRAEAIRYLYEKAERGDVVLLAGKGSENYQLQRGKRVAFSESELLDALLFSEKEKRKEEKDVFFQKRS